jgi:hypothetical protein
MAVHMLPVRAVTNCFRDVVIIITMTIKIEGRADPDMRCNSNPRVVFCYLFHVKKQHVLSQGAIAIEMLH